MAQAKHEPTHPVPGKALFEVDTPLGRRPFIPDGPEPAPSPTDLEGNPLPDNPDNPRGGPSLSLPQQATPLTSDQGVATTEDILDRDRQYATQTVQDGLAEDNPFNPRGTPDYIVEEFGGDPQHLDLPPEAPPPYQSYEEQAQLNVEMTEAEADLADKSRQEMEAAHGKQP